MSYLGRPYSHIIRNEVYIGTFIGRKLSTVRPRETKKNEESEYIKIEGHHESLVTEDLFREAQQSKKVQILSAVSRMKERKRALEIQAE